jgi:hypothetical protein
VRSAIRNDTKETVCYVYAASLGHNVAANAKGDFGKVSVYRKQPFYKRSDQVEFVGDDDNQSLSNQSLLEPLTVCSLFAFCGLWKDHLPHMKIRSLSRDVYGNFYVQYGRIPSISVKVWETLWTRMI